MLGKRAFYNVVFAPGYRVNGKGKTAVYKKVYFNSPPCRLLKD